MATIKIYDKVNNFNIIVNICSVGLEIKWYGKKLKYDTI